MTKTEYDRLRYEARRNLGLCGLCHPRLKRKALPGKALCEACSERNRHEAAKRRKARKGQD